MAKEAVQRLIERLAPFLDPEEPHGLTTSTQVLMSMRLLAGGCYQHLAADLIRVSQSSCSRSLNRFLDALCSMRKLIVKFPENLDEVKQEFFDIAAFPGVIGAIDSTHMTFLFRDFELSIVSCNGLHANARIQPNLLVPHLDFLTTVTN